MNRTLLLCAALVVACARPPEPEPPRPLRAEPLPDLARSLLKKRMGRHAKDLEHLERAAVYLDYDRAAVLADGIAREPRISRPEAQLDAANSLFPDRFFELQDVLGVEAGAVGAAARAHDPDGLSAAMGRLSGTCVACHATYARMPP